MTEEKWTIIEGPDELGYYTACNDAHKYAHVDQEGVPIYGQRFNDIAPFQAGVAVVQDGKFGFHIKPDGTAAYEKRYEGVVMSFEDGLADVFTTPENLVLVMSPDGKITEKH